MVRLLPLLLLTACVVPTDDVPAPDPSPIEVGGPGLGNLAWDVEDLFTPVGWVDHDNGVPPSDTPELNFKPYGTNVAQMHGGYLFTMFAPDSGWSPGGLLFYDVSDPTDPTLVNRLYDREGWTADFREPHTFGFSDFDGRRHAVFHTASGVEFWDLADPMDPVPVGRLALPGVLGGDYEAVSWQLAWQGPYVYVASSERGVFIVDARDPTAPSLVDRGNGRPNPVPPGELGGFRVGPIFAVGNLLVLSSMDTEGGYSVSDISDPANPALLSSRTTGFAKFYSTCFGGNRLIGSVRGGDAAMTTHDISDPFVIEEVHIGPIIDEQLYCGLQDEFVFQGNENDWTKVDVSDPTNPVIVGTGTLGREHADHGQVLPFGNLLWVGNDHGNGSALFPHQAEPDERGPEVTMVSPPDGAVAQALTSRVGFTFSDSVLIESVTSETVRVEGPEGAVAGRFAVFASTVNFAPDERLERGTTYTVTVDGVTDFVGNPLAEPFTSQFTTTSANPSDTPLQVRITTRDAVEVGTPVELEIEVEGSDTTEVTWSIDGIWSEPSTDRSASAQWDEPQHATVLVRATDGAQLATDTAIITVYAPPAGVPSRSSTLALADGVVFVVNPDQGTVTALDAATFDVTWEQPACEGARTIAVRARVWVGCDDGITRLDPATGALQDTLDLGRAVRVGGLIALDTSVFATLEGPGELIELDADGGELGRWPVGPTARGLGALGDDVWVTRFLSPEDGGRLVHLDRSTGALSEVLLPPDTDTVDAEDRSRGLPNYLGAPSPSPDGAEVLVPAKQDNTLRGLVRDGQELTHESAVRAILSRVDVAAGAESLAQRLDFNDRALPTDAAFSPRGDKAYVVLMGSNSVEIVDAYTGALLGAMAQTGSAPRSVLVSADGLRAYVHVWLSRQVAVYDLTDVEANVSYGPLKIATVDLVTADALADDVLLGKQVFTNARDPRMSKDGYISCAVCHLDGDGDGRVWDFTDRGEGLRNTHDLRGRAGLGHGPLHWTANFDEVQDFENDIRGPFGGTGFLPQAVWEEGTRSDPLGDPKAGLNTRLDALAAYVSSLSVPVPSPHRAADGSMTDDAVAGQQLFADLACDACHGGPEYTDSGTDLYDVGTLTPDSGMRRGEELLGLDPPTLRGVHASAPYLHDGSAETLLDVLTTANPADLHGATSPLTAEALDELVAFLRELE